MSDALICFGPRFSKVARVAWWMGHYQAPTAKRHWAYANSQEILVLDQGKLHKWQRKDKKDRIQTAEHYIDRNGKRRYKGTQALRATETLDLIVVILLLENNHWLYLLI